jgi:hypothetical protein
MDVSERKVFCGQMPLVNSYLGALQSMHIEILKTEKF